MAPLTVVAKLVAKKDTVESCQTRTAQAHRTDEDRAGLHRYQLHQDNDDPAVFIFYENWESGACLEQHMNSDHFKGYVSAVEGMIEEKVVNKMTVID